MVSSEMLELGRHRSVIREIAEFGSMRRAEVGPENVFDFSIGNPNVPTPQAVTDTMLRLIKETPAVDLHAYTSAAGDMQVRQAIGQHIKDTFSFDAPAKFIYMTPGAAASLAISLNALAEEGDEVLTFAPYFPEYKVYAEKAGAKFIPVQCQAGTFQVDGAALEAAITPHTKAIIVNSPNNPTGVVLNEESIQTMTSILSAKSAEFGRPIFLIADEPYRELVYDGTPVPYLPHYYPNTIVCYSYSKTLSLPGERIGYIFVSPKAQDAEAVFDAVFGAGRALGYICAPSLFQLLIKECLGCTADISVYDTNRKLLYNALTEYGFEAVYPDGAFYLFLRSPEPDANAFCEKARAFDILMVPSDDFGCTGYVRVAYCVTTEQIRRSLPAFRQLAKLYMGE